MVPVRHASEDKGDTLDRIDMASLLVDVGFADVDPDAEEQLLFCVFHNDSGTKSFSVNMEKKVFHCFSSTCGIHGSAITLYALWKRVSYQQARQEIAYLPRRRDLARLQEAISKRREGLSASKRLDVLTEFVERMPLLSSTPAARALLSRGIPKDLMDLHRLKWYDDKAWEGMDPELLFAAGISNVWRRPVFGANQLLFPFFMGSYVAFVQGRALVDDPNRPKYLGCRGSIPCLFNHGVLSSRPRRVFVTEGVVDALSLEAVGLAPALGVVGTEGFKPEWAEDFKGVAEAWIATDHDAAGEAAVPKLAGLLRPSGASLGRLDFPPQYKDINLAVVGGWRP